MTETILRPPLPIYTLGATTAQDTSALRSNQDAVSRDESSVRPELLDLVATQRKLDRAVMIPFDEMHRTRDIATIPIVLCSGPEPEVPCLNNKCILWNTVENSREYHEAAVYVADNCNHGA